MWHSDPVDPYHTASTTPSQDPEEDDSDIDVQELRETDKDRRQAMMTSMDASEANQLRTGTLSDFWGDFILPKHTTREGSATGDKNTEDHASPRGIPQITGNTSIATCTTSAPAQTGEDPESLQSRPAKLAKEVLWREEIGSLCHTVTEPLDITDSTLSNSKQSLKVGKVTRTGENQGIPKWSCLVCTLYVKSYSILSMPHTAPLPYPSDNDNDHLACSACATPRGDTRWPRSVL